MLSTKDEMKCLLFLVEGGLSPDIVLKLASCVVKQTMAWILDEYSKFHGHSPAVVTGKPIVSTVYIEDKNRALQVWLSVYSRLFACTGHIKRFF